MQPQFRSSVALLQKPILSADVLLVRSAHTGLDSLTMTTAVCSVASIYKKHKLHETVLKPIDRGLCCSAVHTAVLTQCIGRTHLSQQLQRVTLQRGRMNTASPLHARNARK